MQLRKSKADQTVKEIYIILSNISKGTAFLHQGVTNCGFRKLGRYDLNKELSYSTDVMKTNRLSFAG